ncbi:MAG: Planctomycete cytochrome [Verrucomicrobiales bacterium]|nr:Planctomycete cytochrome [Verrucomicrobiales bacterium]
MIVLTETLHAAEMDLSKLPAPATNQINFTRDIKPIFDVSCIRCHGPEKPKSGFRLDNRVAALKGGEDGIDIQPKQSANSSLIHYAARLVPDMEMPPDGKGDPLTATQISLLRAWIDQGALWDSTGPTNLFDVTVSPTMGVTTVSGNSHKFREHYWMRDGFDGGLERFELFQQNGPDTKISVTGHALLDDARITLNIDRNELGFIHSGWDQYRKYYDDNGGYPLGQDPNYPQRLGTDLYLDVGKAWIDFGLTLPHWPRMVLGYEYDYKRGEEAITSWGSDLAAGDARNLAPASKQLNEGVHIIKFDIDAEVQGITIEDRYRGEFYNLNSHYTNLAARASVAQDAKDKYHSLQNANSLRLEKKINDWLFTSGGYFYSKLNADDSFTDATLSNDILYLATVPRIDLTRESHIFNLNGLLGPFDGLTFSTGAQSEWTRQHGFGDGNLNGIAYTRPPGSNLAINPATLSSDYDQNSVSETAGLRYSKIPFTTLFADARLKQESIGQVDTDIQPDASFLENPSFSSQGSDFRTGFTTSPWQRVSFSSHYRRYEDDSHYKTNDVPQPLGGYPGLISRRDQIANEVEAKLVLRAAKWLKTTLTYQIVRMDYREETRPAYDVDPVIIHSDGGYILAGRSDSHIYSFGTTFTPHRRFALTGTFSYQDSKTSTENAGFVPPYKGGVYSALISSTFIVNQSTDLSLNYSMSLADYSQDQSLFVADSPPPLGIRYQQHAVQASLAHRFTKNLSTRLRYAYYRYDEPTLGTANDYVAHSVFATMTYRFP